MSVVIETTKGDITVDLYVKERPKSSLNFLKLCKMKSYNFCRFHHVERNFLAQTGDPSGTGRGGESIFGKLYGDQARFYEAEQLPILKHTKPGIVSMVNVGNNMLGSQFFITLGEHLDYLDGEHCVIGEVVEGHDTLLNINDAICDDDHIPYQDIRITHTVIIEDPFDDPPGIEIPPHSPEPSRDLIESGRIAADEEIDENEGKTMEEIEELIADKEAKARATILEMVGDLPSVDAAPPENVLFVCKLNPVTTDEDLMIIFSRFGTIVSCEIIRDRLTGNSLQYAFIEFDNPKSCEDAYFKMDNVLIDDRRIHVDFSQSVSRIQWKGKGRGVDFAGGKSFDPNKEDYCRQQPTTNDWPKRPRSPRQDRRYQTHERRERDMSNNGRPRDHRGWDRSNRECRERDRSEDNQPKERRERDRSDRDRRERDRSEDDRPKERRERDRSDRDRRERDRSHEYRPRDRDRRERKRSQERTERRRRSSSHDSQHKKHKKSSR
nr:EOG090X0971 [Leptodora kindtii]